MKLNNYLPLRITALGRRGLIALTIALAVPCCVSTPSGPATESATVAKRLGLPNCKVSVPLTQSEVMASARNDGNPDPEKNYQWLAIASDVKPGDEIRRVGCADSNDYFYGLFRNGAVVLRFYSMIYN